MVHGASRLSTDRLPFGFAVRAAHHRSAVLRIPWEERDLIANEDDLSKMLIIDCGAILQLILRISSPSLRLLMYREGSPGHWLVERLSSQKQSEIVSVVIPTGCRNVLKAANNILSMGIDLGYELLLLCRDPLDASVVCPLRPLPVATVMSVNRNMMERKIIEHSLYHDDSFTPHDDATPLDLILESAISRYTSDVFRQATICQLEAGSTLIKCDVASTSSGVDLSHLSDVINGRLPLDVALERKVEWSVLDL